MIKSRLLKRKKDNKIINLKTKVLSKRPGDGHYVAIAITLLLALAIGGIVWAVVGGDSGMINTWLTSITEKVTAFIGQITS